MRSLWEVFTVPVFSVSSRRTGISGLKIIFAVFIIIISNSHCYREDTLQRVKDYNIHYYNVLSVYPADFAVNLAINTVITAQFDESINMATVDSSTFIVNDGAVTGTYAYDPLLRTVTFTPDTKLQYSTLYTVILTPGIKNDYGESIFSDYIWSFTTTVPYYINVSSVTPVNGADYEGISTDITVVFSDIIDMNTVNASSFTVNSGTVTGTFSFNAALKTLTFSPDTSLLYNTPYTVNLTTVISNMTGDSMTSDYVWSFTTAPQYFINAVSMSPASGAVNVELGTSINVEFDDIIDMTTVNGSSFIVNPGAVTGAFSFDPQSKTVIFVPGSGLTFNTVYTVDLTTGIKNLTGESMASGVSWSFTSVTSPQPEIYFFSPLSWISSGDTYDYGSVNVLLPKSCTFTIGNSGNSNLNLGAIDLMGPDVSDFNISVNPQFGTIAAGSTTPVTVDFLPVTSGVKNVQLRIANNDSDESLFVINLTGTGLAVSAPEIQVSINGSILITGGPPQNFGSILLGGSTSMTVVMTNIGSANLNITGITTGGADPGFFSTDFSPIPEVIIPGASKTFDITFNSGTSKGIKKADIIFQNDDADEAPFIIRVKGRGI